jgi:hypothetical protein
MTRIENYVNLQSFACLWGLVPGSLKDEGSPFNECAHAYLAAWGVRGARSGCIWRRLGDQSSKAPPSQRGRRPFPSLN